MRVLVTGASGFIGRNVVSHLRQSGYEVRELKRPQEDVTDADSLIRALHGIDQVVHLAARLSDEADSYQVNVDGARNLVEACKQNSVKRIIVMSTASAKLERKGLYASSKAKADEILLASGIPTTILRPSIVYGDMKSGVFGSLARFARLPFTPIIGDGTCLFRPIYVGDLATVVEIALRDASLRGNIYDVGGPDTLSLNAIIQLIGTNLLGLKKIRTLHIPVGVGLLIARLCSPMRRPPLTVSNILGSTQNIPWDGERMFTDFHFTPRTLVEGFEILRQKLAEEQARREPQTLYRYLYSFSNKNSPDSPVLEDRYLRALAANGISQPMNADILRKPFLLGPLDAATKLLYPACMLQKRLSIASALVETDPSSAEWLLLKQRSLFAFLTQSIYLCVSALFYIVIGLLLAAVPKFVQRHAN